QLGRVRLPARGGLDVQPAARALDEVRVPAEARRLLDRAAVRDLQPRRERLGREREVLARVEGERPVVVARVLEAEDELDRARGDDAPWPLPADAVQRVRRIVDVGAGRVVAPLPAEPPVAE